MRILFVVPPERFDFYNYLFPLESHELILLWHVSKKEFTYSLDQLPLKFTRVIFWNEFATPKQLLSQIKPDKIIFFEIIDLRQIALIVSAKGLTIPTFYLEHGAAGNKEAAMQRWHELGFRTYKVPYLINRMRRRSLDMLRSKVFYYSVTEGFISFSSYSKYLSLPFRMLRHLPNYVLSHCRFRERVPKYSIVFNKVNYEQYELYTGVRLDEALLTGVPFFDTYFSSDAQNEENHLIYIDHPYLEEGILGWDADHHEKIAKALGHFAEANKVIVYVKLHPISNKAVWEKYDLNSNYVKIIQQGDFSTLYLSAKLILGFGSSLINGLLCARKNVVLLGWHPNPHIFGMDFSKTGLCHSSFYPEELNEKYRFWLSENKSLDSEKHDAFLKECNYPFDGKATERVIDAISTLV